MHYLFILTQVEGAWEKARPGEAERVAGAYMALERELRAQGKLVESIRLRPTTEAKTIRNSSGGMRSVAPGPCVQAAEAIGGLYVLDCASDAEAQSWAERMPNYGHGSVEIRPIWE